MLKARFEFKLEDLWVGVFWRTVRLLPEGAGMLNAVPLDHTVLPLQTDWWICLVPCFPLHITWERES